MENIPEDVKPILEKARRGETLDHSEIGILGGHDMELKDFGIEEPSEHKRS